MYEYPTKLLEVSSRVSKSDLTAEPIPSNMGDGIGMYV